MTKFTKPLASNDYVDMGYEAGIKALLDAHITYDAVDRAVACYCYGDSTCGQRVLYQFGMTRIPIYNVNNNCASGSTGMSMAKDFICCGAAECVMVVGFEKMEAGSLQSYFRDRTNPLDTAAKINKMSYPSDTKASLAAQLFGNAANEYLEKNGADVRDLVEIARINHEHSQANPYAQFRTSFSTEQITGSKAVHWPLTKLQCCPTTDGAAAAILVSESFLNQRPELRPQTIEIVGQCLATDGPRSFDGSAINLAGYDMVQHAIQVALANSRLGIQDIKVVELHDCFSTNELLVIDAAGLSSPGRAHEYIRNGQATHGSKAAVINPSGGLLSRGHPLGATGIAQISELVWQLRGWANNRLVPVGAGEAALQENAGLGGAIVVSVLRRADGMANNTVSSEEIARVSGVGYNPAVEVRGVRLAEAERVLSKRRVETVSLAGPRGGGHERQRL